MNKAQAFLEKIEIYDTLIENKMLQIKKLDDQQLQITATMKEDIVAFSGSQDKLGDAVSKFIVFENQLYAEIDYYLERMDDATKMIDRLKDPNHIKVLHKRYVLYRTFEQIAEDMNFCLRQIHNIHGRALQAFERIMEQ